jgi:hypothetical protein
MIKAPDSPVCRQAGIGTPLTTFHPYIPCFLIILFNRKNLSSPYSVLNDFTGFAIAALTAR